MQSFLRRRAFGAAVAALAWAAATPVLAQDHGGRFMERLFAKMDADGNGVLSSAEGEAAVLKMFEKQDADGDRYLSQAEFMSRKHDRQPSAEKAQKLGDLKAKRFAALDKDGDGRVSAEEFFAAAQQRFAAADLNKDGQVTREEIESARNRL